MDLMDRYRSLLATHPQCPLIINYPGWIFGLGLEVATWAVRSLGLSDVVYMSEKGPAEVVEPLALAARDAMIPLTTLPSQPTDFASRSSAQLRSMQMQSYFHMSRAREIHNPLWVETPMSRARPLSVEYAGSRQGIRGIMVMGSQISPERLHDVLDGAVVGVVATESPSPIMGQPDGIVQSTDHPLESSGADDGMDVDGDVPGTHPDANKGNDTDTPDETPALDPSPSQPLESTITRTPNEDLPYLFIGSGSCTPLDPKTSHCLGLALVRSIDVTSRKLELVTPILAPKIRDAVQRGHGVVLVRGQLDNPNWAISEDYHASRAAEKRHHQQQQLQSGAAASNGSAVDGPGDVAGRDKHAKVSAVLRDRSRRASNVPWMTVVEDSQRQREAAPETSLWKLRKRAYPGSESEAD
jgi:polynucleotide 5'-hydroxyl-kinase GRC3/NOL9